ncbi:sodium/proline symporter [Ruminococcaceae bacterium YRB3002]|nr:sodium/proline symporter [Ruminococcaceae bacterium YRB3002]
MSTTSFIILSTIVIYLITVIVIGFKFSKSADSSEFYLGGRKLGPLVTAMSAEASDMSSWLLMGLPGLAYAAGLCDPFWTAVGLALGTYLNWLFIAKRLRLYSSQIGEFTIPGFISGRFGDDKNILRLIAAAVIVIFFIPYTGSGFAACGKLFGTLFNIDYHTAMIISAIVIVLYTTLGGFLAASTTDFIQSIVMSIALVVVFGFGIYKAGGMGEVINNAKTLEGYLSVTATHSADGASTYGVLTTISTLSWGLGYFGMPHILLRFMAIKDHHKLKLSRRIASIWVVIAMGAAILIGIVGSAMTKAGALPALPDGETIIVDISKIISEHGVFATIVAGIILAGILASTMSTADSQLLAASSSVSEDILKHTFGIKLSDKAGIILARCTLLVIGIIGIIVAWDPNSSVFRIVSFAWAGFGAAFAPAIIFGMFWRKTNKWGVLAGMISGGAMVFIWEYLIGPMSPSLAKIYELAPAFAVACIFIVVVSLITGEPSDEVTKEFDKFTESLKAN